MVEKDLRKTPFKCVVCERAAEIEYAIRDVLLPARELEKKGIQLLKLNIGDPNKYDFDTPEHIKKALCDAAMTKDNGYSASEGELEVRDAIREKQKERGADIDISDIAITSGVSESLSLLFGALLSPGDEILIPGPSYPPYTSLAKFISAVPVSYRTLEEEDWQPDVDDVRKKITKKTKAIALINPNNPTGALYPKETIIEIINICGENNLPLISDEIYDRIVFDGTFYSPTQLTKDIPIIVFNGMSKVYLAPGWRIGYTAFVNPHGELDDIKEGNLKQARVRISANAPCQRAYAAALRGPQDHIKELVRKIKERRDFFHKRINEIEGLSSRKPEGAFYIFPKIETEKWSDDKQFVLDILQKAHVVLVHGSGFDKTYGQGHFRSVLLPPIETLEKALDAIEKFMKHELAA